MERKTAAKGKRGFTLIEMLIAIAVFAVMATVIAGAFVSGFGTYRHARELQRDIESAQFMMNSMAKYLRTSTIVSPTFPTADATEIRFYDHSSGRCFEYDLDDGRFRARWKSVALEPDDDIVMECGTAGMSEWSDLTSGYVTGQFRIFPSDPDPDDKRIGRVTILLNVASEENARLDAALQTSVSLRDYGYVEY